MKPEDIAWGEGALGVDPKGRQRDAVVRVRWLGTAGFAIDCGAHTILIDPYLTRASLAKCATTALMPDMNAIRANVPRADAIIVGHTHFDHALDVPAIARLTTAKVFGSKSAAMLCRASRVRAEQIDCVESAFPVEREVGPFKLRFVPSAHSRFALGRVPFAGDIADCDDVPIRMGEYRCGAVFGVEIKVAGKTIFHLGSAEIIDVNVDVKETDLLLLCTAGWTSSRDLPERVATRTNPRAVLLSHWDDFFRPIDRPARALPAMQMPRLVERLSKATRDAKIGTLPLLGTVLV